MCIITDEMQTGKYRLLTLKGSIPNELKGYASINDEIYPTEIVYDMPNSIAVVCSKNVPSFVGYELKVC